jgi:putative Holliday junction resolvase
MTALTLLGLDVGSVRVGVATARLDVRIPQPLTTLQYRPEVFAEIAAMAGEYDAAAIVVGWPRGMQGQETAQTAFVDSFVADLRNQTSLPIHLQDEALTSQKAEAELNARKKPFQKADVDALAATYILEDYLQSSSLPSSETPHV